MNKTAKTLSAVILAAGMGSRLRDIVGEKPKGLLQIDGKELISYSIERLLTFGIKDISIVVGYMEDQYREFLSAEFPFVRFIQNKDFEITGSMHSLFLVKENITNDFLLLESDLLYENRSIAELVQTSKADAVLLSGKTNSGDEVYVYGDSDHIGLISKEKHENPVLQGELVGITKISHELYQEMCRHYQETVEFPSNYHYEDCLSELSTNREIPHHKVEDLAWTEIDDPSHYQRALDKIYPKILEMDQEHKG